MAEAPLAKNIRLFFLQKHSSLKHRRLLKRFIYSMFKSEKKRLTLLSIIFCTDEYLLVMNQQYLRHETYTDIITFDLSDDRPGIKGEIYISIDRVRDNASTYGTWISDELLRVIFHGVLHLCGYGDKKSSDISDMRSKEGLLSPAF